MKRNFIVFATGLLFFLIYTSCTKIDTTDLGNELIPAVDNVNTFETTLNVITDNFYLTDSSRILRSEEHALGAITNDPIFGKTTADIYFDITPRVLAARPFPATDSIVSVDSVILSLAFKGLYGDSNSVEKFQVYEIDQQERSKFIDSIRGYLIRGSGFKKSTLLATHIQSFASLNDSYKSVEGPDTPTISNQMRIRLDNTFAQRFINYDTSVYRNDSTFRNKFAGFAILADSLYNNPNALAYFNLADNNNTKLTFYYHAKKNGVSANQVTIFDFQTNTNANIIKRNPAGTPYFNTVSNVSPSDDQVYLQTSPGSYATLKIPGLGILDNRVIHRAELIVETLPTPNANIFPPPSILFLDLIDTARNLFITIPTDFTYDLNNGFYNVAEFGGILNKNAYRFNISRFVQRVVTRRDPVYTFRLYAPFRTNPTQFAGNASLTPFPLSALSGIAINTPIAKGRVIVGGGSNPDPSKRMKLRIIYSKI